MMATLDIGVNVTCPQWAAALPTAATLCLDAADAAYQAALVPSKAKDDPGAEVSIVLADDAVIRELNRDFRGQDKATNVLSFPSAGPDEPPAPPGEPKLLGDIIVAFETIAAEAESQGKPLADHFCHLIVHGMLHLLGFDHQTDVMAKAMETLEIKVLAGLDIRNPYEDGPGKHSKGDVQNQ
ncbi:MAG: rRNA maturation RNase YbeY [Proteobacteria bacterium]|nr:rRNA maturation RNase YbeY [Pseudomonadota bacterium]